MSRQATKQRDAQLSTPAAATTPAEALAHAESYIKSEKLFEYLADAQDTNMLENKLAAVKQAERSFNAILQTKDSFLRLHDTPFFRLCTRAAANSINVVLQDTKCSLLLQSKLLEVLCALCEIFIRYTRHTYNRHVLEGCHGGVVDKLQMEMTAAGLPSALIKFTAAAWQAVQQLDTNDCQQQQQQQQHLKHKHKAEQHMQQHQDDQLGRFISAVILIEVVLVVWEELRNCLVLGTAVEEVLPLLIPVAATAPKLLQQGAHFIRLSSSSIMNYPVLAKYQRNIRIIADRGINVASFVATRCLVIPAQTVEAQQRQQQIIQADKLLELLLQLVAHQAAKLHKMCNRVSQALSANRAAAGRGQTTEQQQQDQPSADCVVPPHHLALGWHTDEDVVWTGDIRMFAHTYGIILTAILKVVLARHTAAQLNSHSTDSFCQQQQQQQPGSIHEVLPSKLLVPAVKVLIEVLLLLPAPNLTVHWSTLQLLKLLLTTSVTPPAAAAAAEAEQVQPMVAALWPQLPAVVAAGLLQPVIAQLSQAVIYCLLQTDHHQQQRQQQQQSADQQTAAVSQRLALLHDYGCLLLTICQAVESKHIAAVLQSQSAPDLLISLAAIEAAIRAQACHLAPGRLQQQQQQQEQQQQPEVYSTIGVWSNSSSVGVVWDITQYPLADAPLLLLPFVSKVVHSLNSMSKFLLQQQGLTMPPTGGPSSVSLKLSVRLWTLLATALKVGKSAVAAAAPDQQEWVSRQAMENAIMTTGFARSWFFAAHETTNSSGIVVQDLYMSVALMFRALHACSCALTSRAATDAAPLAAEAEAAMEQSSQATTVDQKITSVTLHQVMTGLEQAMSNAHCVLSSLALPDSALTQSNCSGVFEQLLAERSTQIKAHLMRLVDSPAPVDALVAPGMVEERSKGESDVSSSSWIDGATFPSVSHLSSAVCDLADAIVPFFPLTVCCNNSGCTTLTKLSEWQLVCGKACICAGCEVARYCSRSCQQQDWKLHKPLCARPEFAWACE